LNNSGQLSNFASAHPVQERSTLSLPLPMTHHSQCYVQTFLHFCIDQFDVFSTE